jgi:uncharacterized protein
MKNVRTIVFATIALSAAGAQAASFDCRQDLTHVEQEICWDPDLSRLDDKLAEDYAKLSLDLRTHDQTTKEQRAWMRKRDACRSISCIRKSYEGRISQVHDQIETRMPELLLDE